MDALVDFFRDRPIPYPPKDEIAGLLCALSRNDELAELLLLKLYIPGLMAKRGRLFGYYLTQDEQDAALVTAPGSRSGEQGDSSVVSSEPCEMS